MQKEIFLLFFVLHSILAFSQSQAPTYSTLLEEVAIKQKAYYTNYNNAANATTKDSLIKSAGIYLIDLISTEIFPHWYGTPWDFNGTSRIPGKGKIACGYFVCNVLTDIGFSIPRIKWAQSASEVFIKKLVLKKDLKRFFNKSLKEVEQYLCQSGEGLYLVGLDNHVGFILVKEGSIYFIHANYYQAEIGVMAEDIYTKNPLGDSKYRIIGKLFSDEMVHKWITKTIYN